MENQNNQTTNNSEQSTTTPAPANPVIVKSEFKTENPPVQYQNSTQGVTVTTIDPNCGGLIIKRGMGNIAKTRTSKRDLGAFFNSFQIGDVVEVTTQKEAVGVINCGRYRGMKMQQAKQKNGIILVQRIS